MSEVYNLQVKLDKKTEKILRELGKREQRKISNYCKVILTNWANENEPYLDIEVQESNKENKNLTNELPKVESSPKKVLKRPSKVTDSPSKHSESTLETIILDEDTPKITGLFGMA